MGFFKFFFFFFFFLFCFTVCFLQAKEMETCLLSDTELRDTGPLVLFLIDVSTQRSVFQYYSVNVCFIVA